MLAKNWFQIMIWFSYTKNQIGFELFPQVVFLLVASYLRFEIIVQQHAVKLTDFLINEFTSPNNKIINYNHEVEQVHLINRPKYLR